LDKIQYKNLLVINEVLRQQQWIYDHRENKIEDRIVSLMSGRLKEVKPMHLLNSVQRYQPVWLTDNVF